MTQEIKLWIEQAKDDFESAKYNLEGRKFSVVALLVQQSVEKSLKAVFIKKFKEIPKVHDLVFLAKKVDVPEKLFQYCKQLSPYYMQTRYPDAKGFRKQNEFSYEECEDAVKKCEEILLWSEKA